MFTAEIGGIKICFNNKYYNIQKILEPWITDDKDYDLFIEISDEEISRERTRIMELSESYHESFCAFRAIASNLYKFDSLLFHSVAFDVENVGVAFAAHSGVGKTTQMLLWKQVLADKMKIVNGDKPFVRYKDGSFLAYGTPWCGKEGLKSYSYVPLKHICLIKRSETNYVEKLNKDGIIDLFLNQVYLPKDPLGAAKTFELVKLMAEKLDFWTIHCDKSVDGARNAIKSILGI